MVAPAAKGTAAAEVAAAVLGLSAAEAEPGFVSSSRADEECCPGLPAPAAAGIPGAGDTVAGAATADAVAVRDALVATAVAGARYDWVVLAGVDFPKLPDCRAAVARAAAAAVAAAHAAVAGVPVVGPVAVARAAPSANVAATARIVRFGAALPLADAFAAR